MNLTVDLELHIQLYYGSLCSTVLERHSLASKLSCLVLDLQLSNG